MQTVVATPVFFRRTEKLLSKDEHDDLIAYLAMHALVGDEIVGAGGVRKVRFAGGGKGKSGGVRVIYYYYDQEIPIYALLIYAKNERADLTAEQMKSGGVLCRRHQGLKEAQMSKLGDELVRSMAQALAHSQGKRTGARVHRFAIVPEDIQKARKILGLSQDDFANAFGVSASTLRKWEQGQRTPTGAAKTLLKIIEREPKAVIRALKVA